VDLEHFRLGKLMLGGSEIDNSVHLWWESPASLCGELQRVQPFRHDPEGRQRFFLEPDEELTEVSYMRVEMDVPPTLQNKLFEAVEIQLGPRIGIFGIPDYLEAVEDFSEKLDMAPVDCARRFGIVDLGRWGMEKGWLHHPYIGMRRRK